MGVIKPREKLGLKSSAQKNVGLIAAGAEGAIAPISGAPKREPAAFGQEANLCGGLDFSRLPAKTLGPVSKPRARTFQIVLSQSALNKVHAHGDKTPEIEVCGVMVGEVYHDQVGPFLLIEDIIEGKSANGSAGQVTFTADTWQHIQTDMDANHPKQRIVGWYHTHPGHGIFLSDMDLFLHDNFFSMPWQAALVYDPKNAQDGMFGWHFGGADRSDYVIEADAAPAAFGPKDAKGKAKVEAKPIEAKPVKAAEAVKEAEKEPEVIKAPKVKRCGMHPITRMFLATASLGLFVIMGYLLGNFIIDLHIKLPPPPVHLPFFH